MVKDGSQNPEFRSQGRNIGMMEDWNNGNTKKLKGTF
jgi:hypothetical protein